MELTEQFLLDRITELDGKLEGEIPCRTMVVATLELNKAMLEIVRGKK